MIFFFFLITNTSLYNHPNHIEKLWNNSKTAVHKQSPSNLTEPEQFCKERANITESRCVKLIETNPNRLKAGIKAKGGSTKY